MTQRRVRWSSGADPLALAFEAIRAELGVPGRFAPEVVDEARRAVAAPLPNHRDATGLELVTIDPPGSRDLDQAVHVARSGSGYRVRYAIADVSAFVRPGGALDAESRRRGQTLYLPDGRIPAYPELLSESAGSLLPGADRPAFLWDIELDSAGQPRRVDLERCLVRSRAQLDYPGVQQALDAGRADAMLVLLAELGELRSRAELARGGASLPKPEQEVVRAVDGYRLRFRPPSAIEEHNAQVSLLTGMVAAEAMLSAGIGILRTMPGPDPSAIARFRREATALGVTWEPAEPYGALLHRLNRTNPKHLALIHQATDLFRGAGYTAFSGTAPEQPRHAALAASYAHVTAPLRRLVDRFGLMVCASVIGGQTVPDWVRTALPELPEVMATSERLASAVGRACTDAVEAAVLSTRVGDVLDAMVVDDRGAKGLVIQVTEPAVLARCDGPGALGERIRARVTVADVPSRTVRFQVVTE